MPKTPTLTAETARAGNQLAWRVAEAKRARLAATAFIADEIARLQTELDEIRAVHDPRVEEAEAQLAEWVRREATAGRIPRTVNLAYGRAGIRRSSPKLVVTDADKFIGWAAEHLDAAELGRVAPRRVDATQARKILAELISVGGNLLPPSDDLAEPATAIISEGLEILVDGRPVDPAEVEGVEVVLNPSSVSVSVAVE